MILVFAATYEQVLIHFAGPPIHDWKYVQSIRDIFGYDDIQILDLGGWQSDPKKIEAWDVVHTVRRDNG